jgi:hypothetical protein
LMGNLTQRVRGDGIPQGPVASCVANCVIN